MKNNTSKEAKLLRQQGRFYALFVNFTIFVRFLFAAMLVFYVLEYLSPYRWYWHIILSIVIVFAIVRSQWIRKISIRMETTFLENLNQRENTGPAYARQLQGRDLHIARLTLPEGTTWGGKTLAQLRIGGRNGVHVAAIVRDHHRLNVPGGSTMLFPHDTLEVVGDDQSIERFSQRLQSEVVESSQNEGDPMQLVGIEVAADSPLAGMLVKDSGIRDQYRCMIVGVEDKGGNMRVAGADYEIRPGDKLMGLYIVLYFPIRAILTGIMLTSGDGMRHEGREKVSEIGPTGFPWRKWLILTGIILLCMLPLFLLNFPGTLTVDSFDQLSQARGITPFDDHHPWVHTLIIKAFYSIGFGLTHCVYGGIAAYSILQMLIIAMSAAYAIVSVTDIYENAGTGKDSGRTGRIVTVLMLLGFVLCPYNLVYSFTMWKDVLFAASVLILTVTIYRIYVCSVISVRDILLLTISGLGTCLIRHNGLYAYVLTMIVIILHEVIRYRRHRTADTEGRKAADSSPGGARRLIMTAVSVALVLAVAVTVKGPVMRAYHVERGNMAHNLPIPLQQVARVVYDGCELTDEETAALEKLNTLDFLRTEYTPGGADPAMQWLVFGDTEYLNAHKGEYLALWLKLGLEHPEEYIRAYIDQTKGYYTTMAPEQTEYYGILGNEEGLEPQPILGASVRIKLNEIVYKLHNILPVYGILYSMGACFMLLIMGAAIISFGDKTRLLTYLPVTALTLTLLVATPLVADLRYAYPLMLCMPALTVMTLRK